MDVAKWGMRQVSAQGGAVAMGVEIAQMSITNNSLTLRETENPEATGAVQIWGFEWSPSSNAL
jgi:hypothetical protein